MGRADPESRVRQILRQAQPQKRKSQIRPIFLILLILAITAPLAISQAPQEPKQHQVMTYPVPPYQPQIRMAVMQTADGLLYIQPIKQISVGCSTLKVVQPVQVIDNVSQSI